MTLELTKKEILKLVDFIDFNVEEQCSEKDCTTCSDNRPIYRLKKKLMKALDG